MKFGKVLSDKKVLTWSFYYLDYNSIKKLIVRKATSTAELHQREQEFAEILEKEISKINSFHSLKASELIHALKSIKKGIKEQATGDDEKNPKWFEETKDLLTSVTQEFIHFDEYKKINVCAIIKLLKKHDKHQTNQLKGFWAIRLQKEPFVANHEDTIDRILLKLSKCYFLANETQKAQLKSIEEMSTGKDGKTTKSNDPKTTNQNFERSTTKYWVPMDKVLLVKSEVLKHLPISSFNKKSSSLITSVYFDSEDLKLYHERLRKEEGSLIIRMRTYNEPPHSTVYVERKIHHDSWVWEKSVKSRFPIKEKNLLKYLKGELSMKTKLDKMKANNLISDKEYDSTLKLATEIQDTVVKRKLQPTMTSRYERTAFQLEGNATVRVSLDTKLDLISEFGYRDNRWGRDLSNEGLILDSEICHFPHAVLEIKLALEMGEEAPQWVKDLLAQEYIIPCGKFSKFVHGCAVLLPKKVNLLPSWFPLLEETSDFKADDRILRKMGSQIMSKTKYPLITNKNSEIKIDVANPITITSDKDIELGNMKKDNNNSKSVTKESMEPITKVASLERQKLKERIFEKFPEVGFLKKYKSKNGKKKKVQAPIKIEPKTYFANERTFIQWMSFLIIIQGIGMALMNYSLQPALRYGGLVFVLTALIFMVYAVCLFLLRRKRIAARQNGPYDIRWGPILIVILLMIGLIVTLVILFGGYTMVCRGIPLLATSFYAYNPSDSVWDYDKQQLVFVGPNIITYIDPKSFKAFDVPVTGDLEGITSVPFRKGFKYLGVEYPPSILEFDESTSTVTRTIPINIPFASLQTGMEGVTFVPISGHPHGGVFWCGSQFDGKVYVYDIDLSNPNSEAVEVQNFAPVPQLSHISALNYHQETGYVWGILDRRWLFAIGAEDLKVKGTWPVGVGNPEGITMVGRGPKFTAYLSCDSCQEIWKFNFDMNKGFHSGKCGGVLPLDENNSTIASWL